MKKKDKDKKNIISKIFNNDENYNFKELFIVMVFSLCLGFINCFSIFVIFNGGRNYFSVNKDLDKFIEAYYAIVDNYYGDVDKNELLDNAISAMANSVGDEFTVYSDSDASLVFKETVDGVYEGIGCSIIGNSEGKIEVMEVFEGGPAYEAGLKVGDIITLVDGKNISEYDVAHKYGSYEGYVHDYGIVYSNTPYLIGVFTKSVPNAEDLIANISKQVLDKHLSLEE